MFVCRDARRVVKRLLKRADVYLLSSRTLPRKLKIPELQPVLDGSFISDTLFRVTYINRPLRHLSHPGIIANRSASVLHVARSFDDPTGARLACIMNEIVKSKNTNRSSGVSKSSMQAVSSIFDKTRLKRIRSCVPYNR